MTYVKEENTLAVAIQEYKDYLHVSIWQ